MRLTFRLWRLLRTPPVAHPLFQHAAEAPSPETRLLLWFSPVTFLGLLTYFLLGLWIMPLVALPPLFSPFPGFVVLFSVFTSTFYGVLWIVVISTVIHRQVGNGIYDLLELTPSGSLSAFVAISSGCLYRQQALRVVNFQRARILNILLIAPTLAFWVLLIAVIGGDEDTAYAMLIVVSTGMAAGIIFRLDHLQSIVLGVLIGMVLPAVLRDRSYSRTFGVATFMLIQATSHTLMLLLTILVFPPLLRWLSIDTWYTDTLAILFGLLVYYLARELPIQVFWRLLMRLLNAQPTDLQIIQRFVRYTDEVRY